MYNCHHSVFEVQQSHNTDDEDENLSDDGCEIESDFEEDI
jgi:hypothetical protein